MSTAKTPVAKKAVTKDSPWYKKLGPGLITGAADDDPSGIATYSQAGAQFGFSMLWTVLFTYPLMAGIQVISARIGCFSGHGLAFEYTLALSAMVAVQHCRPATHRQYD